MVVYRHAHELSCFHKLSRYPDVFTAGLGILRRVIVRENQGGRIGQESNLKDLARLDDGGGQATDANLGQADDDVGGIQKDD